jgi:hypothetical protein
MNFGFLLLYVVSFGSLFIARYMYIKDVPIYYDMYLWITVLIIQRISNPKSTLEYFSEYEDKSLKNIKEIVDILKDTSKYMKKIADSVGGMDTSKYMKKIADSVQGIDKSFTE